MSVPRSNPLLDPVDQLAAEQYYEAVCSNYLIRNIVHVNVGITTRQSDPALCCECSCCPTWQCHLALRFELMLEAVVERDCLRPRDTNKETLSSQNVHL